MRRFYFLVTVVALLTTSTTIAQKPATKAIFKLDYEKFILPNGLEVVFHIDRSDPVVPNA